MRAVLLLTAGRDSPLSDWGELRVSLWAGIWPVCLHGTGFSLSCRLVPLSDESLLSTVPPLKAGHV